MNLDINYYEVLELQKDIDQKGIKKKYYKLSKIHHPDMGGDPNKFSIINEAYNVLYDIETREKYDNQSRHGNNYKETNEILNFENNMSDLYTKTKSTYDKIKSELSLNILITLSEEEAKDFNGKLEYKRYMRCKGCEGTGKDNKSKIKIVVSDKDSEFYGQVRTFDADGGCDFCEGTGKGWNDKECSFCGGNGKTGLGVCSSCDGDGRNIVLQKISKVKLDKGEKTILKGYGSIAKFGSVYGDLIIRINIKK